MPTLTLHTRFDPEVRTTSGFGHCSSTPQELASGFADLVAWMELGVKPAP